MSVPCSEPEVFECNTHRSKSQGLRLTKSSELCDITRDTSIRGGSDKSLAQPGRKQPTATKLGIYSTYSPRSSIHFLARCSDFLQAAQKEIRRLSVQPGLRSSNYLRVARKMTIKTLESQVGQFLLGCKCPVRRVIVVQEQDNLGDLPAAFFFQNGLQSHRQRLVILTVDSLALWKIINDDDAFLISKNRGENISSGFLHSEVFGAG